MRNLSTYFVLAVVSCGLFATGSAAEPLYRQSPFDEIKLDDANGNATLKVKPLDLFERKVPAPANRRGDLEVELLERPGEKFALPWANVVDVRLFEDRVLAEAEQFTTAGKFDDAQASFRYLEQKHPQMPRLGEAIESFLWVQIGSSFRAAKHDETLTMLVELHRRNPQRAGLSRAFEQTTLKMVEARLANQNYRAARGLLSSLATRFPETGPAAGAPFQAQLQQQAAGLIVQAQAAAAAEKWSEANDLCQRALEVWPAVEGGSGLSQQIHTRYPAVTVGVIGGSSGTPAPQPLQSFSDWHARRVNRLLATPWAELVESEKGPVYRSPLGKLTLPDTRQVLVRLSSSATSAAELAPRVKSVGPASSVVSSVRARGLADLIFAFEQPQLKPEAWLRWSVQESPAAENATAIWGQYRLEPGGTERHTLRRREEVNAPATAPQLVHERRFPEATPALLALRRGQINVLDRVPLWDLPRLKNVNEIRVLPYSIPTVHLLIPNATKPLLANRNFRRGLLYALDRESILKQGLLADQSLPGCVVLSGPFPSGLERNPWTYGCDSSVKPRAYDPGLAGVLLELGRQESGLTQPAPTPLVLAHDDQPMNKIACQSIARQLARVGQPVTLQQTTPGQSITADLQYAELAIVEPLVDAWALLGPGGLAGPCSPLMLEHFRDLGRAKDLATASARLHAIHRLTAAELPVIPLWQTTNFAACHASLQGIAEKPVSLYEDVLQWQVAWRPPQE